MQRAVEAGGGGGVSLHAEGGGGRRWRRGFAMCRAMEAVRKQRWRPVEAGTGGGVLRLAGQKRQFAGGCGGGLQAAAEGYTNGGS